MNQILIYFFIAVGLSMDAFSLALAFGTNSPKLSKCLIASISVGIFHFFMPYLGSKVGNILINHFLIDTNIFVSLIFFILAIEMFISRNEEQKKFINSLISILIFSFTVSIDSFTVGIALGMTKDNIILAGIFFSIISFLFTIFGLLLGKKLFEKFGKKATYVGIAILLFLALKYLF